MKKKILMLSFLFLFLFFPFRVDAASISVAGTTATGIVGGNITVRVTLRDEKGLGSWQFNLGYDTNKLQLTSGDVNVVDYTSGPGETSRTYTYQFRVKAAGTASVYIASSNIYNWDEEQSGPKDSTTIECVTRQIIQESYSANNNLANLEVEGYDLSFDKNVTDYQLEVESDITKIKIDASVEDKTASLTGTGEFDVHEGANSFDVVVTAENGVTKTYHINVVVKEQNPIEVTLNSSDYTVVRKKEELEGMVPKSFEETTLKIGEEEVVAFQNKTLNLTLVALKDSKGKIHFYSYQDNKYTLYQELTGGNLSVHLLKDESKIPMGYEKDTLEIEGEKYTAYRRKNSRYYLVYGENVETGDKNLYLYDSQEKTIQRYYQEDLESLKKTNQVLIYIIIGISSLLFFLLILFFLLLKKRNKKKRKMVEREKRKAKRKDEFDL